MKVTRILVTIKLTRIYVNIFYDDHKHFSWEKEF